VDTGNYLADRAAEKDLDEIRTFYQDFTFLEETGLNAAVGLAHLSQWVLLDKRGSPCVTSLKQRMRDAHHLAYVSHRDEQHHPADPSYGDASIRHASKVWRLVELSTPARARANRIIFNKSWLPWNISRYGAEDYTGADGLCPSCGQIDSQRHLICLCHDSVAQRIRSEGDRALVHLYDSLEDDAAVTDLIRFFDRYRRDASNWAVWIGMWQPHQRLAIVNTLGLDRAPQATLRACRSALQKMNRMLTVVTTFLFGRRYDLMRLNKYVEDHPDRTPPAAKPFVTGSVWDEYDRISKLGQKPLKSPKTPKVSVTTVEDRPGPQDDPPWIPPADDQELDDHLDLPPPPQEVDDATDDDYIRLIYSCMPSTTSWDVPLSPPARTANDSDPFAQSSPLSAWDAT
jgi:hypothetical protein